MESGILIQNGFTGVHDLFLVGDLFVMRLSGIGGTQEQDSVGRGIGHDDVLGRVGFLLAAVEKGLFFRVSGPLAATLGAINDQGPEFGERASQGRQAVTLAFGQDAEIIQGRLQHRQQTLQPIIRLGSTHAEQFTQNDLQRIGLQVDQDKQELVLDGRQTPRSSCLDQTFAGSASDGVSRGKGPGIFLLERSE